MRLKSFLYSTNRDQSIVRFLLPCPDSSSRSTFSINEGSRSPSPLSLSLIPKSLANSLMKYPKTVVNPLPRRNYKTLSHDETTITFSIYLSSVSDSFSSIYVRSEGFLSLILCSDLQFQEILCSDLQFQETKMEDDLTTTLFQQCRQCQFTIQRMIETAGDNEALLFEALNVNDEIQKVLTKYEDLKKPSVVHTEPEPAMIPVAVEPDESPRLGKEDSLIRKPSGSRGVARGAEDDDMMDDLDEMIFGRKSGATSDGAQTPKTPKKQSSKDDLISF